MRSKDVNQWDPIKHQSLQKKFLWLFFSSFDVKLQSSCLGTRQKNVHGNLNFNSCLYEGRRQINLQV